jgi:dihydroflavonol-4-reductase
MAERAAWDFIEKEGGALELSVVNPTAIFGPVLGADFSLSVQVVQRLLNGTILGCTNLNFGVVDVRDVAALHLLAMTDPKAKGEPFLCVSPQLMSILEILLAPKDRTGKAAKMAPTMTVPNFVLRLVALFDSAVALIVLGLGAFKIMSNDKATKLLGWQPRSNVDAVVATGESLAKFGLG